MSINSLEKSNELMLISMISFFDPNIGDKFVRANRKQSEKSPEPEFTLNFFVGGI